MKNLISTFWVFVLASNLIYAQERKLITSDSLFKMFQVMKPFEVLDKLYFTKIDFKTCYFDMRLKPYLMKWLDREEYFQYEIDIRRGTITHRPDLIRDEIFYILTKQNRKSELDSILNNPVLYSQYRDSVISIYVNRYIKNHKGETHYIPDKAIMLHSYLAYPESYTILKGWWEESGKVIDRHLFIALIRLGDPDARKLFDDEIKQCVKSNGESSNMMDIDGELNELRNSYAIAKFIELLKVNINFVEMSEGDPGVPYNCQVINYLLNDFYYKNIKIDPSIKRYASCEENLKHLPQIKAAAQKLIEKYKEEELYWMKNMPFYKK